ncbi:MAG TPA: TlyA family RNA methyltransferase [Actinomycetota bacterium]|nr:TlyA family RNA methyltransferase [Actinomycetota bacterium]
MARRRLDTEMVARGLADDLEAAHRAIDARAVIIDGAPGLKPGTLVSSDSHISVDTGRRFVSRGGDKLDGALEDFGLDVAGLRCLDAGAGSGGFTDCLLRRGAAEVVAVDVGYGQFDYRLRTDPRVTLYERTNVREVPDKGPYDLVVGDLSFVSLRSLARTLAELAGGSGVCLLLVKPQFEVPREQVGPGGIVTDPVARQEAIRATVQALDAQGLGAAGVAASRLKGAAGNQEFFVMARAGAQTDRDGISAALESLG